MESWGIGKVPAYIGPNKTNCAPSNSPEVWAPPPHSIYKLNFDGTTKGNPGPARVGEVVRDMVGEIQGIY